MRSLYFHDTDLWIPLNKQLPLKESKTYPTSQLFCTKVFYFSLTIQYCSLLQVGFQSLNCNSKLTSHRFAIILPLSKNCQSSCFLMQENCQNFENYFLTEYTTVLMGTISPRKVAASYFSQCKFELAKYTSKIFLYIAL